MAFSGVKAGAAVGIGAAIALIAGCGSSNGPNDRHADGSGSAQATTAAKAAMKFSAYYTDADGGHCREQSPTIDGVVSNRVWNHYSCRQAMSAKEIRWRCFPHISGAGPKNPRTQVVSKDPLTERIGPYGWKTTRTCPKHRHRIDQGTYQVTVTQTSDGWIVTGFKTLTGPHS